MSEPKKKSELLQEQIDSLKQTLTELQKQKTTSTEKPQHTHSDKVEFDCPGCQKKYDEQVAAKAISEFKTHLKEGKLVQCDDCGEIVNEEAEECPTCKGRSAHKIK